MSSTPTFPPTLHNPDELTRWRQPHVPTQPRSHRTVHDSGNLLRRDKPSQQHTQQQALSQAVQRTHTAPCTHAPMWVHACPAPRARQQAVQQLAGGGTTLTAQMEARQHRLSYSMAHTAAASWCYVARSAPASCPAGRQAGMHCLLLSLVGHTSHSGGRTATAKIQLQLEQSRSCSIHSHQAAAGIQRLGVDHQSCQVLMFHAPHQVQAGCRGAPGIFR
jgi:hypothetical protein